MPNKPPMTTDQELENYFTQETALERIGLISNWKKRGTRMPAKVLKGLIDLQLPDEEIIAAFDVVEAEDRLSFEFWIMRDFLNWNQNIAAAALRAWARVTDCVLWHRLMPVLAIPELPQRLRYTILEIAPSCHGYEITKACLMSPGWDDLSSAFHAVLFERALQFDIQSERLISLAWNIFNSCYDYPHPEHKAFPAAQSYLIRHRTTELEKKVGGHPRFVWMEFLTNTIKEHRRRASTFTKIEKSLEKSNSAGTVTEMLPAIWSRFDAPTAIIKHITSSSSPNFFALCGFSRSIINEVKKSEGVRGPWNDALTSHLPFENCASAMSPESGNFSKSYDQQKFPLLAESRQKACSGHLAVSNDKVNDPTQVSDDHSDTNEPYRFSISTLFDAIAGAPVKNNGANRSLWDEMATAWLNPGSANLSALSAQVRKQKGLAHAAFIILLGRMHRRDDAVLKLLDYIRSTDEHQLRSVARALGKIDTPRSNLELISMITRPNSSIAVKQEIVSILSRKNLNDLQKELRSAIQDLNIPQNVDHTLHQLKDELSSFLVTPSNEFSVTGPIISIRDAQPAEMNLDQELGSMIPHYRDLSSEVKRALRTALFFNKTAASSSHANSIDLSPLIDMQYKAMELLYREFFEDLVSLSLQSGAIQRKLDVLGYARPIVRQMDEFESYIASLAVIKEIPFFSKFKLRKMLRAICQFEPGRRFTLDGLKAFGLYFLVFGRHSCKAGLANVLNVGTSNDVELAEFCKELHVFQDFRNRAAHEGFHPDASNDIDGIWKTTASVVQWAFKIKDAQKSTTPARAQKAS